MPISVESSSLHSEDLVQKLPLPENKRFYPALDGLRAVAVLMVFYEHYLNSRPALAWGWAGVDIFFVLSGFLITGILYDSRNAEGRFGTFYIRRTLRIFPLYYGVLLIALLLNPVFHWVWHPAWYLWPFYLGNYARFLWVSDFLKGDGTLEHLRSSLPLHPPFFLFFGHFWSLCVEEQFYLVWPLVVFLVKDRIQLRNLCAVVCLLSLAARVACLYLLPPHYLQAEILYRLTPLRADALLLGGLLALVLRGPEFPRLGRMLRPAMSALVFGFIGLQAMSLVQSRHFYYPSGGVLPTLGYTLIDLFAGGLILLSLEPSSLIYRVLTIKPLRRLGQMSYGFYVFHDIPHMGYLLLGQRLIGSVAKLQSFVAVLALTGTLMLSYLSFRFFETPFLRLKDRFTVSGTSA